MTTHCYFSLVTLISFFIHGHLFKCTWEHAHFTKKTPHMLLSLSLSLSHVFYVHLSHTTPSYYNISHTSTIISTYDLNHSSTSFSFGVYSEVFFAMHIPLDIQDRNCDE
ncbi:hypothetical protein MtrunA17_Chr5g0417221 [Medicago truncatula]|uniref:Transmembrane protein n=1 Tax=Medicago truncatula TaxID=3880 RepID=A0A396HPW6_MEDTR|nr:hypothetical protein MtrunA17_Chr5g0417221 [Medicago truncatula]